MDEQGTEVSRGVNHADGSIAFNYIEYRHEDVGLHRYTIREVQGDLSNVTYDGASYTVEVLVEYVDDQLTATAQGEPNWFSAMCTTLLLRQRQVQVRPRPQV